MGRKQFHADCDYIDCVGCNVSDADMAVFAARSKTGEFSRVKTMILVSFSRCSARPRCGVAGTKG